MSRPIQYNPNEVIINAMNLFWTKGYESTSVKDIVASTGMKPGSLYNLYGNKEGVFNAVLDKFSEINITIVNDVLDAPGNPLKNIENFLTTVVLKNILDENTKGCLLVKTLMVVPANDKKIENYISTYFDRVEFLIKKALEKAVSLGYTNVNPNSFSKFIIMTIYGVHSYNKVHNNSDIIQENINILLDILKAN